VWATASGVAIALPFLYLGLSAFIEWSQLAGPPYVPTYVAAFRPIAAGYLIVVVLLALVYFRHAATGWDRRGRVLALVAAATGLAGCVRLPFLISKGPDHVGSAAPALQRTGRRAAPLLVVGLDGGTWRVVRPVMERGGAPTLARLVTTGVHGEIPALWPPYWSAPAWAAIMTGHPREDNDVHEDLAGAAPGLPIFELPLVVHPALNPVFAIELTLIKIGVIEAMPTPRSRLQWPPIWERLSRAGVNTAVIRFPFTYPATGQARYVVSNRVVTDFWAALGVNAGKPDGLTEPPADAAEWLESADKYTGPSVAGLVSRPDWPKPADAWSNPIEVLANVVGSRQHMHDAALARLRKDPSIALMMVHVVGFDEISHAFWQYRFPEDFPVDPPARADVEVLGPVLDRFVELLDRQLAELIAAFPVRPNVLIVADHGEGPVTTFRTVWRGEHGSPGLFVAAGPDIASRSDLTAMSYFDIAPTLLDLAGFSRPVDLNGRSVFEAAAPQDLQ
jgi:hypothetical protein